MIATLALSAGGLGLSSAHRVRSAAHFASWADALSMVRKRHPVIAESMIRHLEVGGVPCFQAARQCREVVAAAGFAVPSWAELSFSPPPAEAEPEPNQPRHSWQQKATRQLETRFVSDVVWPGLTDARRALLRSQHGPLASAALTALPSSRATRIDCLSVCSFAADCIYLSPCLTAPADVAANLTCSAIIAQRARRQGCWGSVGSRLSAQQRKYAGRQAFEWPRTCSCATWTLQLLTHSTAAGWRSWRTVLHCSEEPSSQSTRQWCPLSRRTARPGQGQLITMVLCWRWRDAGRKQPNQSSPGKVAALVLWSSPPKLVGGGTVRRRSSSQLCLARSG